MNHGADEVTFRGNGVNNLHNLQQWALENPHATQCSFQ
jgi:hypothetical protein